MQTKAALVVLHCPSSNHANLNKKSGLYSFTEAAGPKRKKVTQTDDDTS